MMKFISLKNRSDRASLVALRRRIHRPRQGTRARSLSWEDPTCPRATNLCGTGWSPGALITEATCGQDRRACARSPAPREQPRPREARATGGAARLASAKETPAQQGRPSTTENKDINKIIYIKKTKAGETGWVDEVTLL